MDQVDLLRTVVDALERLRVRYLVTGSTATIYYGEPRFTNDIDIVVQLPAARVAEFCRLFPSAQFYLDEASVRDAVAACGQFNLIHPQSGLKVDFIIPPDTAFERSRFSRRVRARPGPDFEASFAAPEDVIVKKLEYYAAGGSEKHLRDITGILKTSGDRVDRDYVARWAAQLGVAHVWEAVLARLGKSAL
jgi:hypothetical protein